MQTFITRVTWSGSVELQFLFENSSKAPKELHQSFFFFSFWLPIKFVLVLTFDVCSCMVNWGVYTLLLFGNWINKCIVVLAIWELFSVDYTRKYFLWFYFIFVGSPLYCLSWKLDKKKGKKGLIHGLLKLSWGCWCVRHCQMGDTRVVYTGHWWTHTGREGPLFILCVQEKTK